MKTPKNSADAQIRPLVAGISRVVMLPIELEELIERIAERVQEERDPRPAPYAVTGAVLARSLSVSRMTVNRWRKLGMPAIQTGDEFRYVLSEAVEWLKRGGAKATSRGGES